MKNDYVFITDLHIMTQSNVRTGDVLSDLKMKLEFVVAYANANNATILIGGDIFDKSTVPDFVKSELAPVFLSAKHTPYAIMGNHDQLFCSDEKDFKTSAHLWFTHNILKPLNFVDMGEYVLHSQLPLKTIGKPQLVMFHGFLNIDDGKNTVHMSDLQTTDQCLLLLGHDHKVYDPVELGSVRVVRPGSLLRGIRNDDNMRIPKLVHIKVDTECKDRIFKIKMVPIKCRDAAEIFKTKEVGISKQEEEKSYAAIIDAIKNSKKSEMGLFDALRQFADPDVVLYIKQILEEEIINLENK